MTRLYDVTRVTNQEAWLALEMLLARPQVTVVDETPGVMALLSRLGAVEAAAPRRWMDAYLAAVAIAGGWPFLTLDRECLVVRPDGLQLELLDGR
jgi:predicted nucleic acid-binding protein